MGVKDLFPQLRSKWEKSALRVAQWPSRPGPGYRAVKYSREKKNVFFH